MKKYLSEGIIALAGIFLSTCANAEDLRNYYGIQAGYVSSSALTTTNTSSTSGFDLGLLADFSLASWFSIQPELRFMQKGFAFQNQQGDTISIGLNYLELPVLAKFKVPTGSFITPYVYLGPYVAFRTGDNGTVSSDPSSSNYSGNIGFAFSNGDIQRFDAGITIGLGFEVQISADIRTFAEFERSASLSSLVNKYPESSGSDAGPTSSDILAGLSFAF